MTVEAAWWQVNDPCDSVGCVKTVIGPDTRIAGPRGSFFYILLVTALFYGGTAVAIRAFAAARPRLSATALFSFVLVTGILAPVLYRMSR